MCSYCVVHIYLAQVLKTAMDAYFTSRRVLDVNPLVFCSEECAEIPVFTMKEYVNARAVIELNRDLGESLIKENLHDQEECAYYSRKDLFRILDSVYSHFYVVIDITPVIKSIDTTSGELWNSKSNVIALGDYAAYFRCVRK